MLLIGLAEPKSSFFPARGGRIAAPMPPLPIGETVSHRTSFLPEEN